MLPNFLPAIIHNRASPFILSIITNVWVDFFGKHSHFSHSKSPTPWAMPMPCEVAPSANDGHHALMFNPTHCLGRIPWSPSHSLKSSQILMVNQHVTKIWSVVSVTCLQRGWSPQLGHPCFCNLSAVQAYFGGQSKHGASPWGDPKPSTQ
jgi:hypothetical protein